MTIRLVPWIRHRLVQWFRLACHKAAASSSGGSGVALFKVQSFYQANFFVTLLV